MDVAIKLNKLLLKFSYTTQAEEIEMSVFGGIKKFLVTSDNLCPDVKETLLFICNSVLTKQFKQLVYVARKCKEQLAVLLKLQNSKTYSKKTIIYLSRLLAIFINWLLTLCRSPKTQFSTAVGIALSAYNNLPSDNLEHLETLYEVLSGVGQCEMEEQIIVGQTAELTDHDR